MNSVQLNPLILSLRLILTFSFVLFISACRQETASTTSSNDGNASLYDETNSSDVTQGPIGDDSTYFEQQSVDNSIAIEDENDLFNDDFETYEATDAVSDVEANGPFTATYRMYGEQKKVVNSRALANSYKSYLTGLGASTTVTELADGRFKIRWSMVGTRSRSFKTRRVANFYRDRLRSLGFHVTVTP